MTWLPDFSGQIRYECWALMPPVVNAVPVFLPQPPWGPICHGAPCHGHAVSAALLAPLITCVLSSRTTNCLQELDESPAFLEGSLCSSEHLGKHLQLNAKKCTLLASLLLPDITTIIQRCPVPNLNGPLSRNPHKESINPQTSPSCGPPPLSNPLRHSPEYFLAQT